MADEWWSSTRIADDGGSPCSKAPATDHADDAAESAATSTTSIDFRPSLHVVDTAAPPSSFLHHMDWTQAYNMGGRAPPAVPAAAAAEAATTSFNALLQLHGDVAGRHFQLGQQVHADGAAPVAAASQSVSLYAGGSQPYSGDVSVAALMTKPPFPRQEFSSLLGSPTRSSGDMPAVRPTMTTKPLLLQALEQKAFKSQKEEPTQDGCSSATRSVSGSPSPAKKLRVATPSPLPTFKVRKEKLGDRITALQQLVSPFGKTDTASVLHEAIEYIRFLHDQVASLSSPYMRCGRPLQQLQQQPATDGGEAKEDLRSRGLCLVPVASTTYAVAASSETAPPEFWPPTFGGT